MQKARSHRARIRRHSPRSYRLYAHGFRFSFTRRQAFFSPFPHGTLRYRSQARISPWRMVPPASTGISRAPAYSGTTTPPYSPFAYGTLTLYGPPFQARSATLSDGSRCGPTTPRTRKGPRFGLFPFRSPLLRKSHLIPLPPGTEMFQFPGFALPKE